MLLEPTGPAAGRGFFARLANVVVRRPWLVIAFWVAMALVLPPLFPSLAAVTQKHPCLL